MKRQNIALLTFVLLGIFVSLSCRKIDHLKETLNDKTIILNEDRFFNTHRTTDPTEKAIVDFMKRENDKKNFVHNTVNKIGFPRWDKMLSFNKSKKQTERSNSGDSSNIFYIPFVRNSQNYVNASLVVKVLPSDTIVYYLCDWQYNNKVHGSPTIDTTAERYALLFMILNNQTLGHTKFNITDPNLFKRSTSDSGSNRQLTLLNVSSSAGQTSKLESDICVDFYVCNRPDWCNEQENGCDYLNCASGECWLITSECTEWWDTGGGGGDSGGENGSGTGENGGGTGGGGDEDGDNNEPPDCSGTGKFSRSTADPCDSGWEPTPIDDDEPISEEPCKTTKEDLKAMFPNANDADMQLLAYLINTYGNNFGITSKEKLRHFLAQTGHETGGFTTLQVTENLYYTTPARIVAVYPSRFTMDTITEPTKKYAGYYTSNPSALSNVAMCCQYGNGDQTSGDGWRYRGRGIMQLTWKGNYQDFKTWYNKNYDPDKDFVGNPDLISTNDTLAIMSGLWFYKVKVIDKINIDSTTTVRKVCIKINGGTNGLSDRMQRYQTSKNSIFCR